MSQRDVAEKVIVFAAATLIRKPRTILITVAYVLLVFGDIVRAPAVEVLHDGEGKVPLVTLSRAPAVGLPRMEVCVCD